MCRLQFFGGDSIEQILINMVQSYICNAACQVIPEHWVHCVDVDDVGNVEVEGKLWLSWVFSKGSVHTPIFLVLLLTLMIPYFWFSIHGEQQYLAADVGEVHKHVVCEIPFFHKKHNSNREGQQFLAVEWDQLQQEQQISSSDDSDDSDSVASSIAATTG